jgi:hypothetical protein
MRAYSIRSCPWLSVQILNFHIRLKIVFICVFSVLAPTSYDVPLVQYGQSSEVLSCLVQDTYSTLAADTWWGARGMFAIPLGQGLEAMNVIPYVVPGSILAVAVLSDNRGCVA